MSFHAAVRPGESRSRPLGLTSQQAQEALARVGPNRLPTDSRRGLFARVLDQLRDPMLLLLIAAGTLTVFLGDVPDTVIIAAVVVFNTTMGVVQQLRAERAMEALRSLTRPLSRVYRDGLPVDVPSEDVVPGDVVSLVAGDVVPADGSVLDGAQLQVNQAIVTGESLPVEIGPGDALVGGTSVTRGRATMAVTRTGTESGIGTIAAMLASTTARATPLQRRLAGLSRSLVLLVTVLVAAVVVSGLLQGRDPAEMAVVGLSLAVAAVPESLPAVVVIALAMGAHRMAQRNAVIRHLPAVETLGSVTVVATDKTGTITEGAMVVQSLWTPAATYSVSGEGYAPHGEVVADLAVRDDDFAALVRDIVLCNDAELRRLDGGWVVDGDPLEGALLALGAKAGTSPEAVRAYWRRVDERPFDQQTMTMTTEHVAADGAAVTVRKGAPEAVLLDVEETTAGLLAAAEAAAAQFAEHGLRVLAVADRDTGDRFRLRGLVAIGDPPRGHARRVVGELQDAGIRLVLVTGDHVGTAASIAREVGILESDTTVVEGADFAALGPRGADVSVVARVRPEQKVEVVDALIAAGEVVAMVGDGVNDAPALRRADIGVAAGKGGSEVAKQAADLVLMDDDLSTVVAAVQEGRRILANIRAFLVYALSGGLAEVAVMLLGPVVGLTLPLLPAQILWINLLTHGTTGVAFGGEPAAPEDMRRPPISPDAPIFGARARVLLAVASIGLTTTALLVGGLTEGSEAERRTAVFLVLGLGQLGVALALRARVPRRSLRERGLELAVLASSSLMVLAFTVPALRDLLGTAPLPASWVLVLVAVATVPGALVRLLLGAAVARGPVPPGGDSAVRR